MRHPYSETRLWGHFWVAKYAVTYLVPTLVLQIFFLHHSAWLVGLTLYWFFAVAFFAWRAANENVGVIARAMLGLIMIVMQALYVLAALVPEGDTKICYDQVERSHIWGPLINHGPSSACEGTRLQDVQVD